MTFLKVGWLGLVGRVGKLQARPNSIHPNFLSPPSTTFINPSAAPSPASQPLGVAVIMVHEPKKQFYKRFLYEPFPVESSLQDQVRW
jgi:hypothetical protein